MRKFFVTGMAVAMLAVPSVASADVSTNGTTSDAHGYGIANHIANFNGDFNGIGHLRSEMSGKDISGAAGNRAPAITVDSQGTFAPISNNGK